MYALEVVHDAGFSQIYLCNPCTHMRLYMQAFPVPYIILCTSVHLPKFSSEESVVVVSKTEFGIWICITTLGFIHTCDTKK
jgi:hypothetical protein